VPWPADPAPDPVGTAGRRSSRTGPANPAAAAPLPTFSNAELSDFPCSAGRGRSAAAGATYNQRAAHPGCFASFPVHTIRVARARDRPNDRPIAAAVPPAAPVETGEMHKAGDNFTTQFG
jgi:hypothetical protein